jgi:hypothetical protein
MRPYLKKTHPQKRLVEWLKVKALNSNPSTAKKKKKKDSTIYDDFFYKTPKHRRQKLKQGWVWWLKPMGSGDQENAA